MTTSWTDQAGTDRFVCLDPPNGGEGDDMKANVFLGYPWPRPQPESPAVPTVALGTSDLAIEVWALRKFRANPSGSDEQWWTGLMVDDGSASGFPDPVAALQWQNNTPSVVMQFNGTGSGSGTISGTATIPQREGLWNHYCMNCDRSGNMELFINAISEDTEDISSDSGDSMPAADVHPLTADNIGAMDGPVNDWSASYPVFPVIVGPMAVHNRLLTRAEMVNSYRHKKTQNLGSGVTLIRFNFNDVDGETDWDTNQDHIINGIRAAIPCPAGVPRGTAGDVKILDSSGNERHFLLPVRASYGTTFDADTIQEEGEKSVFALGTHPFFR